MSDPQSTDRLDARRVAPAVIAVLRTLRGAGKQAYLAGGAVRDLLRIAQGVLLAPPHDFDVATDALPEDVQRLFPRTAPTGIAHGTVTVLADEEHKVEVTTFRGEGPYLDGRRPSSVTFLGDIDGDLARRDFTVNAMAWDPFSGELRDPFGGAADLRRSLLRAVGDPLQRFREDGLRPMRAVRFACTLRLALDRATERAIPQALDVFAKVAWERIREELTKLLVRGDPPSRGLRLLRRTGLLARIAPELLDGVGFEQNAYHAFDVFRHTLRAVDFAPPDLAVRLAALLHDVAKPKSAQPPEPKGDHTFYKHELMGEEVARQILLRLRYPTGKIKRVALLVREHNWYYRPEWNDATVRRTIARIGPEALPDLWALRRADLRARGRLVEEGLANQQELESRFDAELRRASALKVKDLAIGGDDVMKLLALPPGPHVGKILTELLDRVLDDPQLNTREALLRLASEVAAAPSTGNPQP
jgi:tRNA nucleotidyltransferase (CCA-adding enzyme)